MSAGSASGGRVTVYGHDIMRPPLCDDTDAQMVVIRNVAGDPILILVRLVGDKWAMSDPDDRDWPETCIRLGLMSPKPVSEVLAKARSSLRPH